MIEVWSTGQLFTQNALFFKAEKKDKAYLHFKENKTQMPTEETPTGIRGEFMVAIPGEYKIQVGSEIKSFSVQEYKRFSVEKELLFTASAVMLFFIVLIIKRKNYAKA